MSPLAPAPSHLLSSFCSSPRNFAYGFLQTPPHGDSPCLSANLRLCVNLVSGLSPDESGAMPGTLITWSAWAPRSGVPAAIGCEWRDLLCSYLLDQLKWNRGSAFVFNPIRVASEIIFKSDCVLIWVLNFKFYILIVQRLSKNSSRTTVDSNADHMLTRCKINDICRFLS